MCEIAIDGPAEVEIRDGRVVFRGTSDGDKVCFSLTLNAAQITAFRFSEALKALRQKDECLIYEFPSPLLAHADSA